LSKCLIEHLALMFDLSENFRMRGVPLDCKTRRQIYNCQALHMSALTIHQVLFAQDPLECSLSNIRKLVAFFHQGNRQAVQNYLRGPNKFGAKEKPMLKNVELKYIMRMIQKKKMKLSRAYVIFRKEYYGRRFVFECPSLRTFRRAVLKRIRWTRKVMERRHMLASIQLQWRFLDRIRGYDHKRMLDIDEMSQAPDTFHLEKGYAPLGQKCIKDQIIIGTRSFSSIASFGFDGFEDWSIHEGTIDSTLFQQVMFN